MRKLVNVAWGDFIGGRAAWGLLVLRLIFGLALMQHGLQKLSSPLGPTAWMGPKAPVPGFLQFLAVLSEAGGGLALAVGLLSPLAALGVLITMATAVMMAHAANPWVASGPGPSKEPALGYLAFALTLLLTGPGRISLDSVLFGRRR